MIRVIRGAMVAAVAAAGGLVVTAPGSVLAAPADPAAVYISEIHYDNVSTDVGEAIEVTGPAGADLTGWSLVLYNGSGGAVYDTDALSGVLADQASGVGTAVVTYPANGIQNGAPDGVALEHRVEGDHALDVGLRHLEVRRDLLDRAGRQPAARLLHDPADRQHRARADGVARDDRVELALQLVERGPAVDGGRHLK